MSTITVKKNGILQTLGVNYTISNNNVVFVTAPLATDYVSIRKEVARDAIETSFNIQQIRQTDLVTSYSTATSKTSTFATATSVSTAIVQYCKFYK